MLLLLTIQVHTYSEELHKYRSLFVIHKMSEKCWQNADEEKEI